MDCRSFCYQPLSLLQLCLVEEARLRREDVVYGLGWLVGRFFWGVAFVFPVKLRSFWVCFVSGEAAFVNFSVSEWNNCLHCSRPMLILVSRLKAASGLLPSSCPSTIIAFLRSSSCLLIDDALFRSTRPSLPKSLVSWNNLPMLSTFSSIGCLL